MFLSPAPAKRDSSGLRRLHNVLTQHNKVVKLKWILIGDDLYGFFFNIPSSRNVVGVRFMISMRKVGPLNN
jgi:hypothetical protein